MNSQKDINKSVKAFVKLHPGQYTMRSLAQHLGSRNGSDPTRYLGEIRAMMGTELALNASRTVGIRS